jgi:hypothetical protein
MKKILIAAALVALSGSASNLARADTSIAASCFLTDRGNDFIDGPCRLTWLDKKKSAFSITDGKFEGMIMRDNTGYVIGDYHEIHKSDQPVSGTLEGLHRKGACWISDDGEQQICAGKPGEKVDFGAHP